MSGQVNNSRRLFTIKDWFKKCVFYKSRFASIVLDLVLWPLGLAQPPRWCSCFPVVLEATHEVSQGPLKGTVSAQKALQGSEKETRELLGGTEETCVSSTREHWFALQANQWFFPKRKQEKIVSGHTWRMCKCFPGSQMPLGTWSGLGGRAWAKNSSGPSCQLHRCCIRSGSASLQRVRLAANSILFCFLFVKNHQFACKANRWPHVGERLLSSIPQPSTHLVLGFQNYRETRVHSQVSCARHGGPQDFFKTS